MEGIMQRSGIFVYPFLVPAVLLFLFCTHSLSAAAGSLVSIRFERSYSRAEIDRMASQLFDSVPAPAARYSVDVHIIRYESRDLDDRPTIVTAQLFVPRYDKPAERPVYVMAPGTTGLTDACRTSREHEVGVNWGLYRHHVLSHAGQGVIGVIPDYMYFGVPDRLQPYFVPEAEGRVLLDTIRAVMRYFRDNTTEVRPFPGVFLAGFSQGGHAAFAAADIQKRYAPDARIAGIIGYGPTTDIESLFRTFSVVAPPIIYTYARLYGTEVFDPGAMLPEKYLRSLEADVRRLCILGLQSYYPWKPGPLFLPAFTRALVNKTLETEYPEIHRIFRINSTGLSGHGIPALILQGSNDVVVDTEDQAVFVTALREAGSDVRYLVYPGNRHDTRQAGFSDAREWMQQHMQQHTNTERIQ
jgi:acetyl esterase/lipase